MTSELSKKIYSSADYKGLSDAERRIFRATAEDMESSGRLKPADTPMLASYARNVNLARLASRDIEKYGVILKVVDQYRGETIKENPAVNVMLKAQTAYESCALKLGLTPTGRKRLHGEEKPAKSASDVWEEENG